MFIFSYTVDARNLEILVIRISGIRICFKTFNELVSNSFSEEKFKEGLRMCFEDESLHVLQNDSLSSDICKN